MKLFSLIFVALLSVIGLADGYSSTPIPNVYQNRLEQSLARALDVHSVQVIQITKNPLNSVGDFLGAGLDLYSLTIKIKPSFWSSRTDYANCQILDDNRQPDISVSNCESQTATVPDLTLPRSELK